MIIQVSAVAFRYSLVFMFLVGSMVSVADAQLYRYKNKKDILVIDDKIPPEFVANGYDVLKNDGSFLRHIDRQLTEQELLLRNTEESMKKWREEEEARLRTWDESLMRRYSSVEDIRAAQTRATRDLSIRISILRSNLIAIKSQIEREQKKAADIERRGNKVHTEMLKNIDILRLEIEDTEQSVAVRSQEIASVKASYERDIERFSVLQERFNLRNKQSSSSKPARSTRPR